MRQAALNTRFRIHRLTVGAGNPVTIPQELIRSKQQHYNIIVRNAHGPGMKYTYIFRLSDGTEKSFEINLDPDTLKLVNELPSEQPEWTRLEHMQCENCPLSRGEQPRCPIAANIVDVAGYFKNHYSYEDAEVTIISASRTYTRKTTLQNGLSSMMGLYMVTSGCPVMDKLRPLVHSHLPFATLEESMFRIVSIYLLAQYYKFRRGENPDWELHGLNDLFNDISTVNRSFANRLQSVVSKDANVNALVILNCVADMGKMAFESNDMDDLEYLFTAHMSPDLSM
jgi:hypothetical protein